MQDVDTGWHRISRNSQGREAEKRGRRDGLGIRKVLGGGVVLHCTRLPHPRQPANPLTLIEKKPQAPGQQERGLHTSSSPRA